MNPVQRIETRNAFFAGFGTSMVVQAHGVVKIDSDVEQFEANKRLLKEVSDHFSRAVEVHDAQRN